MATLTMVPVATKTPADWLQDIAELGKQIEINRTLISEKREERRGLSLLAVQGDAGAIERTRKLADEIDRLTYSGELLDDALITANEHMQTAERAAHDARIAAILAERARVQDDAAAMRPRYVELIDELVSMLETTYNQGLDVFRLTEDAGQVSNVAGAQERRIRRTVANYLLARLRDTYLYRDWDFPTADPNLRREALALFSQADGAAATNDNEGVEDHD